MDSSLALALALTAAAAVTLSALVTVIKVLHRESLRWRGVRVAHYVAAVGEIVSRRMIPARAPRGWAQDPSFHGVLSDYRLLLTGADRLFVDEFIDSLGLHQLLIARTRSRFSQTRRLRALSSLVDLADSRHLDALRLLAGDRNRHVRVNAVRGLSRLGDVASTERILDLAAAAQPWEAARLADALVAMGSPAVEPISNWVKAESRRQDGSGAVVALAARVLGLIGDPSAGPTLVMLLQSDRAEWRLAAASALEHAGGDEAVAPLLAALEDSSWNVRARAAVSVGTMADPAAGTALARLLTDAAWWVRQNAAGALGVLPGGIEHLMAALDHPDRFAADAALNQLTVSGALAEAAHRLENGSGSDHDRLLVGRSAL